MKKLILIMMVIALSNMVYGFGVIPADVFYNGKNIESSLKFYPSLNNGKLSMTVFLASSTTFMEKINIDEYKQIAEKTKSWMETAKEKNVENVKKEIFVIKSSYFINQLSGKFYYSKGNRKVYFVVKNGVFELEFEDYKKPSIKNEYLEVDFPQSTIKGDNLSEFLNVFSEENLKKIEKDLMEQKNKEEKVKDLFE